MGKNKGRKNKLGGDTTRDSGYGIFTTVLTSGSATVQLILGAFGTRGPSLADAYTLVRWLKFRFRIHPSSVITNAQIHAFVPGITDTIPASITAASECKYHSFMGIRETVPTDWVTIAPADLAGALPWYKTVGGTSDVNDDLPGSFISIGTGAEVMLWEYEYSVELKGAVNTASTPEQIFERLARRKHAEDLRRRAEILGLFGPSSPPSPALTPLPAAAVSPMQGVASPGNWPTGY